MKRNALPIFIVILFTIVFTHIVWHTEPTHYKEYQVLGKSVLTVINIAGCYVCCKMFCDGTE